MNSLQHIMNTARARHRRRTAKRINEWLNLARDGLRSRQVMVDGTEDENSPQVHFEG